MQYPNLRAPASKRQTLDIFKGYNHNLRIGDGEFYDMKNLTAEGYPLLMPRGKRGLYATAQAPTGLIAKDALCYTDGRYFVINEHRIDMGLNEEPKQLVSMGAYVIILPDKKYISTIDHSDRGNLEAEFTTAGETVFTLCTEEGADYILDHPASAYAPEAPADQALWLDTSTTPHSLKQWSEASGLWVSIATTYVRIRHKGIGAAFSQYDGVSLSGLGDTALASLEGAAVIWQKGEDYIVITGILDEAVTVAAPITVSRKMPLMDFVIESENRLWGCRYGPSSDGKVVNEIYASKLGDFKNWNCFMGISTDSYAASLGTDGQFTGAITHLGYPLFFKENYIHKVYGSQPSNFQMQTTACRGVEKGSEKSLALVNETLFYKAPSGIVAYDGSLPREVSRALGPVSYHSAVAGSLGNCYYVSMAREGQRHLFVYDTARGLWHRQDDLQVDAFCPCRGELYALCGNEIWGLKGDGEPEAAVSWMAETGPLGLSLPDMKYVSRLTVRLMLEPGARCSFYAQYEGESAWEPLFSLTGTHLRSFSIPIRPRRCDHMKLRLEGQGVAKLYSLTKTIEEGSERS